MVLEPCWGPNISQYDQLPWVVIAGLEFQATFPVFEIKCDPQRRLENPGGGKLTTELMRTNI